MTTLLFCPIVMPTVGWFWWAMPTLRIVQKSDKHLACIFDDNIIILSYRNAHRRLVLVGNAHPTYSPKIRQASCLYF